MTTELKKLLERICQLATEIEESPAFMGMDDIERLTEIHELTEKALEEYKR